MVCVQRKLSVTSSRDFYSLSMGTGILNAGVKTLQGIGRLRGYFLTLGWRQAAELAALDMLRRSKTVRIAVNGIDVLIRSNTTDYEVAKSALQDGDYLEIDLEEPKIIIDLGANIGTSAIALHLRFPQAKIFAVEMEKSNFELLEQNVSRYPNIIAVNVAIAAHTGLRVVFDRSTGPWGYTIAETENAKSELGEMVQARSLDSLVEEFRLETIDLLKIDIEGAEKELFEAGGRWLSITKVIIVELHDRITMGASRAFYLSTVDFSRFERHGEKIVAYRH